jgi:hypothetical protein
MTRRVVLAFSLAGLLASVTVAADGGERTCCKSKKACASRATEAGKLRCSLSGDVVERCCCVRREGAVYCTLAKRKVDSCCCEPPGTAAGSPPADRVPARCAEPTIRPSGGA